MAGDSTLTAGVAGSIFLDEEVLCEVNCAPEGVTVSTVPDEPVACALIGVLVQVVSSTAASSLVLDVML
jgi:hypothetical protein